MPNDDTEQERLDLYHHIFLLLKNGQLYTAPLDKPQNVLDIGTGTGIWALDFAEYVLSKKDILFSLLELIGMS